MTTSKQNNINKTIISFLVALPLLILWTAGTGVAYAQSPVFALNFDGVDDRVEIPNVINGLDKLTIEAWFRYDDNNAWRWIYGNGPDRVDIGVAIRHQGNNLRYHFRTTAGFVTGDGNTQLQPNVWYHLALTYDGSTLLGYVNGSVELARSAAGKVSAPQQQAIGAGYWNANELFKGRIDEVRIWNVVVLSCCRVVVLSCCRVVVFSC